MPHEGALSTVLAHATMRAEEDGEDCAEAEVELESEGEGEERMVPVWMMHRLHDYTHGTNTYRYILITRTVS